MNDGTKKEADYNEVRQTIINNEQLFLSNGLTSIEATEFAPTWLHSDCRWIPIQTNILIIKPTT